MNSTVAQRFELLSELMAQDDWLQEIIPLVLVALDSDVCRINIERANERYGALLDSRGMSGVLAQLRDATDYTDAE